MLVDDLYMCNADERGKCKDVFNDDHKVTGKYSSGADGIQKLFWFLNFCSLVVPTPTPTPTPTPSSTPTPTATPTEG